MKPLTIRERIAVLLLISAVAVTLAGWLLGFQWLFCIVAILGLIEVYLILHAVERDNIRSNRRFQLLGKKIGALEESQSRFLLTASDYVGKSGNTTSEEIEFAAVKETACRLETLINEMNQYVEKLQVNDFGPLSLSQLVSLERIISWIKPTVIGVTRSIPPSSLNLRGRGLPFEEFREFDVQTETALLISTEHDFLELAVDLTSRSALSCSAIVLVCDAENSDESVNSIAGFKLIMPPVDTIHAVKVFYPAQLVSAKKFQKLIEMG